MKCDGMEREWGLFSIGKGLARESFFEKGIFEQEIEGNKGGKHQTFCGCRSLICLPREETAEDWRNSSGSPEVRRQWPL